MVLVLASSVLVAAVLVVAGVRYVTSVPGIAHTGGLPTLADAETVTASRLRTHIQAIASRPHNIERLARITHGIEWVVQEMIRPDWPTAAAKPHPF